MTVSFNRQAEAAELARWPGTETPSFILQSTDGTDIGLGAKPADAVFVHFFATWCEPCREELPALKRLADRGGSAISILAISVAEVDPAVRRFLQTTPVNFPVLLDRDRAVAKAWNVSTLPTTVILDNRLKPRLVVESDYAWDTLDLRQLIDNLAATRSHADRRHVTSTSKREENNNALQ